MNRTRTIVALILCFVALSAKAESDSTKAKHDAGVLIHKSVQSLNSWTIRFQGVESELGQIADVDSLALDSTKLFDAMNTLLHMEQYLTTFRQRASQLVRVVADSVKAIEWRYSDTAFMARLDEFVKNDREETNAFVQYALKCSEAVLQVRSAIVLLQNHGVRNENGVVKIMGGREIETEYDRLKNKIRVARDDMQSASQAASLVTGRSNELVVGLLDYLGQQ